MVGRGGRLERFREDKWRRRARGLIIVFVFVRVAFGDASRCCPITEVDSRGNANPSKVLEVFYNG
jgi:hypothetical protein